MFSFCHLFYGHQRVSWFHLIQTELGSWFLLVCSLVLLKVSFDHQENPICNQNTQVLNTVGFLVASAALMALPQFRTSKGVILCSSVALGFLALGRAGFAVNHMDIAPRYAGIVMGVSNTAGTLAGVVGVHLTGKLLEASKLVYSDLSHQESWRVVFFFFF